MTDEIKPYDPRCERLAVDIPDVVYYAGLEELTPNDWVRQEEGTYNPANGHFLCDECYIAAGMPSSPTGWKCP